MTSREYALIVAGGKGTRFGSPIPKQFLELNGRPIIIHTLEAFIRYSGEIQLVLVLPEEDISVWEDLRIRHRFDKPVVIAKGGPTRFQSVKNGLAFVSDDALVAIHDGVRPLITTDVIQKSFTLAAIHGAAVASVPLKESLRFVGDGGDGKNSAVDRSQYRSIQTPQTFKASLIRKAYSIDEDLTLTDDASVAEKAGVPVHLFDGSYVNIKITTPEDLVIARALLSGTRSL